MGRLIVFNFTTLNGFYKDPEGGISWHRHGREEGEYAEGSLEQGSSTLLFGRVTYEMMAGYWPTQLAAQNDPVVAKGMNNSDKIVFSKTLKKADWQNTRIVSNNIEEEIKKIKQVPGRHMTVLGSGSIVTLLSDLKLVDEYQVMVDPVALGRGTPMFSGLKQTLNLQLTSSKVFKSGVVLLVYKPEY